MYLFYTASIEIHVFSPVLKQKQCHFVDTDFIN